jgi:hypothetical protein
MKSSGDVQLVLNAQLRDRKLRNDLMITEASQRLADLAVVQIFEKVTY